MNLVQELLLVASLLALVAGLAAWVYFYNRYRELEILLTDVIRRKAVERARRGESDHADPRGSAGS